MAELLQDTSRVRPDAVYVRCNSHRAREKLSRLMGDDLQCYYHMEITSHGGFYLIPQSKLEEAKLIKGMTESRVQDGFAECWS